MSLLPLWFKGLTPQLREKAMRELGETPEIKAKALAEFKSLVEEQKDLYTRTEDEFLLRFLRVKKFDTRKALKLLRNYLVFRTNNAEKFTCLKPSDLSNVGNMHAFNYFPYRNSEGSHIAVCRPGKIDLKTTRVEEVMAYALICGELVSECEATQVCGGIIIIDFRGLTLQHYAIFLNISFVKFLVSNFQECWPQRINGLHLVFQPTVTNVLYHIAKPFVKKKIMERVHFHGDNLSSLHKHVSKEILPDELGGTQGPYNDTEFVSYFLSQDQFIERINRYGKLEK